MGSHSYTELTIKKLYSLSGNICAFPTCNQELITKDEKSNISEICHIDGEEINSPRYNSTLKKQQLDDYENLILMCRNHHKIIDDNETTYTVDYLKELKRKHEEQNKRKGYQISAELVRKIIQESLVQTNVNTGSGTQIVTQTGNITQNFGISSISEAQKLFEILFEQNFPKLQEEAQKIARESAEKFCQTFLFLAKTELKPEDIKKLSNPDLQFVLNSSIMQAGRHNEQELRDNLAHLLVDRIKNSDNNLRRIAYNEAIETIGKLTVDGLKITTLCFILRYARWNGVFSLDNLDKIIKDRLRSLLDFKNTPAEFQHLVYAGCGELGVGSWSYPNIIQASYYNLEPLIVLESQLQLHKIPGEIISELFTKKDDENYEFNVVEEKQLEDYLTKIEVEEIIKNSIRTEFQICKNKSQGNVVTKIKNFEMIQKVMKIIDESELKHLSLTSVGIVIGAMYYERITGEKTDVSIWIN